MKIHKNFGMTLIELMVVVGLISIISLVATPMLFSSAKTHYKSTLYQLHNDFQFAKRYANLHKTRVSLCPSSDDLHCHQTANDWSKGWLVFVDKDASFIPEKGKILRHFSSRHPKIKITSSRNIGEGININYFRRYGKTLGAGLPNGRITICLKNYDSYDVIVNIYGRARYEKNTQIAC